MATLALAGPILWLWTIVGLGGDSARLRAAFTYDMGDSSDFLWTPDAPPATYRLQAGPVPASFQAAADQVVGAGAEYERDPFQAALAISRLLMSAQTRNDKPIRSDARTTLSRIVNAGNGYCADFVRVFDGIAHASEVSVRSWSISFIAFGAGHVFNEIYDTKRGQWVLVDSFHSIYFIDPVSSRPLSVLDVHDRLLAIGGERNIAIRKIVPERFPFRSDDLALDYYRRGMTQLAMLWGNDVFDYDANQAIRIAGRLSRVAEQAVGASAGLLPGAKVYPIGVSEKDWQELLAVRHSTIAAVLLVLTASFLLVFLAVCARREQRSGSASDGARRLES